MAKTRIEWATHVWNPATGCTKVSPGCEHCYAERMARRLAGRCGYPEAPHHFDVTLRRERLEEPLRWRKPRTVFVCSMGDLFHKDMPDGFIGEIFDVMRKARKQIFFVLTKRPKRMREFQQWWFESNHGDYLSNVWLGVSVESADYMWRIDELEETPAAKRIVSFEPLLGPVAGAGLERHLGVCPDCGSAQNKLSDATWRFAGHGWQHRCRGVHGQVGHWDMPNAIDWVIAGGESGPGARPMHPDWVRGIRDQCVAAGVPFFFKQWGAWIEESQVRLQWGYVLPWEIPSNGILKQDGMTFYRAGKGQTGRVLDGRTWDEMPR